MTITAANFRAARETCGLTQQHVADAMGVRPLTVKRWESGATGVPADVERWIGTALSLFKLDVRGVVEDVMMDSAPGDSEIALPYYRTQEQADLDIEDNDMPYQYHNAVSRSAADILESQGYAIDFAYPDEEMVAVEIG